MVEFEMTFLEFFEALVGCAQVFVTEAVVKDPNTPRPSTAITREQSYLSVPASQSRMQSQAGGASQSTCSLNCFEFVLLLRFRTTSAYSYATLMYSVHYLQCMLSYVS